ncbi:YfbU family protein [Lentisphaerota bacterium ZTH]|nr:YfbU family protein [Lentisphaerota bacterium]WET05533.1 YfbU family protein [Lentisphaerota bacterium ZTH]
MKENLTEHQRLLLQNQFMIMEELQLTKEHLDIKESPKYEYSLKGLEKKTEIMFEGFHSEIDSIFDQLYDGFSCENAKFVIDVLSMYRAIMWSTENFPEVEQEEINKHSFSKFKGFDGNNECDFMGYAKFFVSEQRFVETHEIRKGIDDFNSHMPAIGKYQRMLSVFNNFEGDHAFELSKDIVLKILNA